MSRKAKGSFWKRQFSGTATPNQDRFDIIFGIVLPILFLVFDPIVFQGGFLGGFGYLQEIQLFAYLSIGFGISMLAVWLFLERVPIALIAANCSVFFLGALLATLLGIALLPLSLLGLLMVIGVLGFVPFVTAFVFLRNGVRSLRVIQAQITNGLIMQFLVLGLIVSLIVPLLIDRSVSYSVSQSIQTISNGTNEAANLALQDLESSVWCIDFCHAEIVSAFQEQTNEAKKQRLADAYARLTGENIGMRLSWIDD